MTKSNDSGSTSGGASNNKDTRKPVWGASFFMQTTEDVARAVASAASAVRSPRPSIVSSSKDDSGGTQLQRLQRHVSKMIKGFSESQEVRRITYNPEDLTSQKRQWASFQLQYLDHVHRSLKEPLRLFESMVVVGLHPNCDIQALHRLYTGRKCEGSEKLRSVLRGQNHARVEPNIEPQVLFVYPPKKPLPLKDKDLLSFCFPGGLEVHAVERTPSMSELNEILFSQEHLKLSELSFVFRLQVADNSTLYGCCVLVEEVVQRPSGLLSMISDNQPSRPSLSRHILTTHRCYCILSRLPFFELHFGVLNSIFTEEKLEQLLKVTGDIDLEYTELYTEEENKETSSLNIGEAGDTSHRTVNISLVDFTSDKLKNDECLVEHQSFQGDSPLLKQGLSDKVNVLVDLESYMVAEIRESCDRDDKDCCINVNLLSTNNQVMKRPLPSSVVSLLRCYQYDNSETCSSFQGSPNEDASFRTDVNDMVTENACFSGQEDSSGQIEILEWAKAHNRGSLRILCEYYRLPCPPRGTTLKFHPLEHLHPLEYHRPDGTALYTAGSTIDLRSCSTSLEFAEARSALLAEEEATALSTRAVACICGLLRLENVLTMFAGALLEKQIVVVCSNLGILSASVLSIIPLIRPYQWQSLLMPVLPDDMLDFLDAPVPYIVGVKNKTSEVQSKLTNVIIVDANKNQVKSSALPQLPHHKELYSSLSPYHAKLVGESYLARKKPVYECTDVQVEAAKGFLSVLRSYLDSLCSNLRSHTITNVQSHSDKVSLLLKESFIDSYPGRDRPFMKHFVDTQLFSVHTDLVLSFIQKQ